MSKSEQQRQRKLAKKKAKEREDRKSMIQRQQHLSSLAGQMAEAAKGELDGCYIASACHSGVGIGSVLIARRAVSGQRTFALFLVDAFCLGVKDVVGKTCSATQLADIIEDLRLRDPIEAVEPGVARGYVEAAIAYAQSLGFAPHSDYRKVAPLWGDIQATEVPEKYKFGRNGRPAYIAGPYDDQSRQMLIINTLTRKVGAKNYDYVVSNGSLGNLDDLPDDYEEDEHVHNIQTVDGKVIRRIDEGS
jgi:hypothetical protein